MMMTWDILMMGSRVISCLLNIYKQQKNIKCRAIQLQQTHHCFIAHLGSKLQRQCSWFWLPCFVCTRQPRFYDAAFLKSFFFHHSNAVKWSVATRCHFYARCHCSMLDTRQRQDVIIISLCDIRRQKHWIGDPKLWGHERYKLRISSSDVTANTLSWNYFHLARTPSRWRGRSKRKPDKNVDTR